MGPVWAYWAFPMEWYCSDILHHIRSWRFPYASINKYVTSHAQLTQISLLYNLDKDLQLAPRLSHDQDVHLPLCEFFARQPADSLPPTPDPLYVLTPPMRSAEHITDSLWKLLTATLSTCFEKPVKRICQLIPKTTLFDHYGWACQLEGGNTMHGCELIQLQSDSWDMSFVQVSHHDHSQCT